MSFGIVSSTQCERFDEYCRTDVQINTQASLPLTLVPIRIDLDIASFTPQPALPLPSDAQAYGINPSLPAYKTPDPTPAYRLKDYFLWNLQEAMMTPDQFALTMVQDLDLPNPPVIAVQISNQIRQQLEEYATVAAHPLFRTLDTKPESGTTSEAPPVVLSKDEPVTPVMPSTQKNHENGTAPAGETWSAKANDNTTATVQAGEFGANNPDDAYRCIVSLNINLGNKLFTDKFEWSLIHPPGSAEKFTRQLCADMGLAGEWVPAIVHGIYEAVLKLKKEVCESGNLTGGEIDNMALEGQEAGWRFDPEHLCEEWEPKIEILSKEEIEKRDGDRERQIRRVRRETARFSSTTNMAGGMPTPGGLFDQPDHAETPMGRGERSKKRKRMRSLSPTGRGGTPAGTPDTGAAGYGSAGGLNEWCVYCCAGLGRRGLLTKSPFRERVTWRCSHCLVHGTAVWAVRDGPSGPKVSSLSPIPIPPLCMLSAIDPVQQLQSLL